MIGLFKQRNIVSIIVTLSIFSGIVGASSINYEMVKINNECKFCNNFLVQNENLKTYLCFSGNQPPETPDITGPTTGKPGVELSYKIVSTDPEKNDIVYCFDWGDGTGQICIGPYPSGEEVTISHTWIENGTYTITVKAADILGGESGLATLKVKITTSRTQELSKIILFKIISRIEIVYKNIVELLGLKN